MTQVTQLIIRPSQEQTRNLERVIIDVARKQPATHETLLHIRTLVAEALDMMSDSRSDKGGKNKKGRGDDCQNNRHWLDVGIRLGQLPFGEVMLNSAAGQQQTLQSAFCY